jgi:hypothetical protein
MSSDQDLTNFVGLSAVLTGFTTDQLFPPISPDPVAVEYLNMLKAKVAAPLVNQILTTFQNIAAQNPPDIKQEVQQQILDDPQMGPVARNIIRMWYLSIWYDLNQPQPITGFSSGTVVSMNAYTKGLAWDAAQAHPMGYSEMHYGYWAAPPVDDSSGGS